jgi:hypothetical protein
MCSVPVNFISQLLVSYSINFFTYEDSEKHRTLDPNDPEPADKGAI